MKLRRISKRSGGYREVAMPSEQQKQALQSWLPKLNAIAIMLDVHRVQHGFVPGRSPVSNALCHVGYEYTVSFDLKDCFDHVHFSQVSKYFNGSYTRLFDIAFVDGVAKQGLPTSPAFANIALSELDSDIVEFINGRGVYTRYADDMTFSTNDKDFVSALMTEIPAAAKRYGHEVNMAKTECQWARNGRRIITGVGVDDKGIYPTRATKRRLRAAEHAGKTQRATGLREWTRLKEPNAIKRALKNLDSSIEDERNLAYFIAST